VRNKASKESRAHDRMKFKAIHLEAVPDFVYVI
jgi:hypothetical protein